MQMLVRQEGLHDGCYFYHKEDGFHYHISEIRTNVAYFKCIKYERQCFGRAILRSSGVFIHSQLHNHPPDMLYPQEMDLRRRILRRSSSREYMSFRDIINSERMNFHPLIGARMTSKRLRSQMYKRRTMTFPPFPQTLRHLHDILQMPNYSQIASTIDETDNLFASTVSDANGQDHMIFVSQRMLAFMSTCRILFSDGTFKSTPQVAGVTQVFCITTIWRSHVLPLAWVLMSSKSQVAYVSVLNRLHDLMGQHQLQRVITDFELAEQNAWRMVFNAYVQGCLFHFSHDVLLYAFGLGLKIPLQRNAALRAIVSWCCILPLLPDEFIDIGIFVIGCDTMEHYPDLYMILRDFLSYIFNQWVNYPARRLSLSVSGSKNRTNNACETHNRWLLNEVGTPHPNIYHFIRAISRIEQSSYLDIITLCTGGNPSRRRKAIHIVADERISSLTQDLYNSPDGIYMAVRRFLNSAVYSLKGLIDRTVFDGNVPIGHQ